MCKYVFEYRDRTLLLEHLVLSDYEDPGNRKKVNLVIGIAHYRKNGLDLRPDGWNQVSSCP